MRLVSVHTLGSPPSTKELAGPSPIYELSSDIPVGPAAQGVDVHSTALTISGQRLF